MSIIITHKTLALSFYMQRSFVAQEAMEIAEEGKSYENSENEKGGAIYTRWGSHDCPEVNGMKLIY